MTRRTAKRSLPKVLAALLLALALTLTALPAAADDGSTTVGATISELWDWLLELLTDPLAPPPNDGAWEDHGNDPVDPMGDPPPPGHGPGSDPDGGG